MYRAYESQVKIFHILAQRYRNRRAFALRDLTLRLIA